ncbi:MAG: AIM24 family protein, partial [Anaerolineales bacterium]
IFKGLKRAITGESFFITTFLNNASGKAKVAFAAPYPGKIIPISLNDFGGRIICQKDSFLCAAQCIEIEIAFTKRLGAGVFGGEGFILQRLEGDGLAFVHAGGTIVEKDLVAGETLRVDTGCLVAFNDSVNYDIKFIGGFTNALFGGEGLFLATLTGPGKVYLQSLPFSRLADRVLASARFQQTGEKKGVAGIGGDILGDLISGR